MKQKLAVISAQPRKPNVIHRDKIIVSNGSKTYTTDQTRDVEVDTSQNMSLYSQTE